MRWMGWVFILSLCLTPHVSWARGGGGCLAEGTLVLTPEGMVGIQELKKGDLIYSVTARGLQKTRVQALLAAQPEEYTEVSTFRSRLEVTSEHLVMVDHGEYRLANLLQPGDTVFVMQNGRLKKEIIRSIRPTPAKRPAYNLLVSPGGTFVAEGFVVHNKGCFLADSLILRADGTESMISAVRPGDELLAFKPEGRLVRTRVRDVIQIEADQYFLLVTEQAILRVTADHPFYVGKGTYKTVEALKVGDGVFAWDGKWLSEQRIVSLQRFDERVQVYNLQNDHPNTFFAGRIAVHNKGGGCFPAGTEVATPGGPVAIETLAFGDEVWAVTEEGKTVRTVVKGLFVSRNRVLRIETGSRTLTATEDHPVSLGEGRFRSAGGLRQGDHLGKWKQGRLMAKTVRKVSPIEGETLVFNLQVAMPNTFVAEGIVVHNKGGSSSRSSSSSSRSSGSSGSGGEMSWKAFLIIFGIMFSLPWIIVLLAMRGRGNKKSENLDFVYRANQVSPKVRKTEKLLTFLSRQDPSVSPEELRKLAETTFLKLQECWEKRDYAPMKPLLMPALFAEHTAQLQGLMRNHEINRIENIRVEKIDLVNVRYTEKSDQREFTALVTASARDYYVDDRTLKFIRGDEGAARFQEFWTFQGSNDTWLLREIEQAGESDVLKDENFVEMLTDDTVKGIYREVSEKEGKAGPWLEKNAEEKAIRIERMLNFLVQTDKLWDRNQMLERARQVFLSVYLSRESGDPGQVPATDLFPEVAANLEEQVRQSQASGIRVEYRNLCVRKVDLLLARNFSDPSKDEFTVRISAHAQKVVRQADRIRSEQEYVTPFEEYWTFGRLDQKWKLKEVLPPGRGKKKIIEDNVDEDSTTDQLQWYYRQTRAN